MTELYCAICGYCIRVSVRIGPQPILCLGCGGVSDWISARGPVRREWFLERAVAGFENWPDSFLWFSDVKKPAAKAKHLVSNERLYAENIWVIAEPPYKKVIERLDGVSLVEPCISDSTQGRHLAGYFVVHLDGRYNESDTQLYIDAVLSAFEAYIDTVMARVAESRK